MSTIWSEKRKRRSGTLFKGPDRTPVLRGQRILPSGSTRCAGDWRGSGSRSGWILPTHAYPSGLVEALNDVWVISIATPAAPPDQPALRTMPVRGEDRDELAWSSGSAPPTPHQVPGERVRGHVPHTVAALPSARRSAGSIRSLAFRHAKQAL
jgi:hypothetical protein